MSFLCLLCLLVAASFSAFLCLLCLLVANSSGLLRLAGTLAQVVGAVDRDVGPGFGAAVLARPAHGDAVDLVRLAQADRERQLRLAQVAAAACHLAAHHPAAGLDRHLGAYGAGVRLLAVAGQRQPHPVMAELLVVAQEPRRAAV